MLNAALLLLFVAAATTSATIGSPPPPPPPFVLPPLKYISSQSFRGAGTRNYNVVGQAERLPSVHDFLRLVPSRPSAYGALFAQAPLEAEEWVAEVAFRMHGESSNEGGRGLGFWYSRTKPGGAASDSTTDAAHSFFGHSIKFDGLGIIFDATPAHPLHPLSSGVLPPKTTGPTRGVVSFLLDDGTTHFLDVPVAELKGPESQYLDNSLGECEGVFRNAPGIVWARISNFKSTIRVDMDLSPHNTLAKQERNYDHHCLSVSGISLPSGSYLGITGLATASTEPDSIDIYALDVYEVLSDGSQSSHEGEPADSKTTPLEGTRVDPMASLAHDLLISQASIMASIDGMALRVQELSGHLGIQPLTSSPAGIAGQLARIESRIARLPTGAQDASHQPPTGRSDSEALTHLLQLQERLSIEMTGLSRKVDSITSQSIGSTANLAARTAENLRLLQQIAASLEEAKGRGNSWVWILAAVIVVGAVGVYVKSQSDSLDWRRGGKKMI